MRRYLSADGDVTVDDDDVTVDDDDVMVVVGDVKIDTSAKPIVRGPGYHTHTRCRVCAEKIGKPTW